MKFFRFSLILFFPLFQFCTDHSVDRSVNFEFMEQTSGDAVKAKAIVDQESTLEGEVKGLTNHEGLNLIMNSDCKVCHAQDAAGVGPSFIEISQKYKDVEGANDSLAANIINGSVGKWGEIPMPNHLSLSTEEAVMMTEYILQLEATRE